MNKFCRTFIAILIMLSALAAHAQATSAVMLAMQCQHAQAGMASVEAEVCFQYLLGFLSGANLDRDQFCLPNSFTGLQAINLYTQYFSTHPELTGVNRATAAYFAFKSKLKCGKSGYLPLPKRKAKDPVDPRDTGYALLQSCNSFNTNPVGCLNYLLGVTDGANVDRQYFCPGNESAQQLPFIYQRYAQSHPESLGLHQTQVVKAALNEAFKCE